jgi:hypothetical protein
LNIFEFWSKISGSPGGYRQWILLKADDQSGRLAACGKGLNGSPEYTKYLLLIFHEQTAVPDRKRTGAGGSFRKLVV